MGTGKAHTKFRQSKKWKAFRTIMLVSNAFTCALCGTVKKKGLHVHHLNTEDYENLNPADFKVVCPSCHRHVIERFHIKKSWGQYADLWHLLLDKFMEVKK
jgi:5-methylcytosine-specific restriction endonuclease McrA